MKKNNLKTTWNNFINNENMVRRDLIKPEKSVKNFLDNRKCA